MGQVLHGSARTTAAVIHSTHSHLTTRTTVNKSDWDKFVDECPIDAERVFLIKNGFLPRVAEGARLTTTTDDTGTLGPEAE